MMTNKERQEQLDKARWIKSEHAMHDCGGQFEYCEQCEQRSTPISNTHYVSDYHCNMSYDNRQKTCACAKAYNKHYKNK